MPGSPPIPAAYNHGMSHHLPQPNQGKALNWLRQNGELRLLEIAFDLGPGDVIEVGRSSPKEKLLSAFAHDDPLGRGLLIMLFKNSLIQYQDDLNGGADKATIVMTKKALTLLHRAGYPVMQAITVIRQGRYSRLIFVRKTGGGGHYVLEIGALSFSLKGEEKARRQIGSRLDQPLFGQLHPGEKGQQAKREILSLLEEGLRAQAEKRFPSSVTGQQTKAGICR